MMRRKRNGSVCMKPLSDKTAGFTDSVIRRMTRVSNQDKMVRFASKALTLTAGSLSSHPVY